MSKSITLLGLGPVDPVELHAAVGGGALWGVNRAPQRWPNLKFDRVYDLHRLADIVYEGRAKMHLANVGRYELVTFMPIDGLPSRILPLTTLQRAIQNLRVGSEPAPPEFKSSFDYMLVDAVLDGFQMINVLGFPFKSGTEYHYQRESAKAKMLWAAGRGVEIFMSENTDLFPEHLYGWTPDHQTVSRQTLEALLRDLAGQHTAAIDEMNAANQIFYATARRDGGNSNEEKQNHLRTLDAERITAIAKVDRLAGALHVVHWLISEIDNKKQALKLFDLHKTSNQ